jgi:hypothetical protein
MKVSCCCFCVNIGIVLIFKIVCRFSLVFGGGDVYGGNDGQGELDDGPGGPDKEIEISSGGRKGFEGRRLVAAVGLLAAEEGFMAAGEGLMVPREGSKAAKEVFMAVEEDLIAAGAGWKGVEVIHNKDISENQATQ